MLLILILLILQIFYNFKNLTEANFSFAFQLLPAREIFRIELPVWQGLLIMFLLGFGLAILFEIYYWAKYTLTIRSQNKLIRRLQKTLESIMPQSQAPQEEAQKKSD
jgi:uncharacterized membrane protein YciS (DUF1049 family)